MVSLDSLAEFTDNYVITGNDIINTDEDLVVDNPTEDLDFQIEMMLEKIDRFSAL